METQKRPDGQKNELTEEYDHLRNPGHTIPKATVFHYDEDHYFKLSALTRTFQMEVQEMLNTCIDTTFALANGSGAKGAIKVLNEGKPDNKFQRIADIYRELHRINKDRYPELAGAGNVNWENEVENLKLIEHSLRNGDYVAQDPLAELNLINHTVRLIEELIQRNSEVNKVSGYP